MLLLQGVGSVSLAEGPEAAQKKLRALQKKLRQIQQLKEKRDKEGEYDRVRSVVCLSVCVGGGGGAASDRRTCTAATGSGRQGLGEWVGWVGWDAPLLCWSGRLELLMPSLCACSWTPGGKMWSWCCTGPTGSGTDQTIVCNRFV
jgi:hypothetical protein